MDELETKRFRMCYVEFTIAPEEFELVKTTQLTLFDVFLKYHQNHTMPITEMNVTSNIAKAILMLKQNPNVAIQPSNPNARIPVSVHWIQEEAYRWYQNEEELDYTWELGGVMTGTDHIVSYQKE